MAPPKRKSYQLLALIQRLIERTYRIETNLDVNDFLLDSEDRKRLHPGEADGSREALLMAEQEDELHLGLYLDEPLKQFLDSAEKGTATWPLQEFCLAVEGVSHFLYVIWKARNQHRVSGLELELQAEVDKFVLCLAMVPGMLRRVAGLRHRLFGLVRFAPQVDAELSIRYRHANRLADKYCNWLEQKYLRYDRQREMRSELRQFYRRGPKKVNELWAM